KQGVANYFGAQRFGPGDASLREAERFLRYGRAPRSRKEEFLVSVFQAALFNAWLDERVRTGLFAQPLEGDVMWKAGNHAPFTCTEPSVDAERMARQEILLTGPLFGSQMRRPGSDALTFESRSLAATGVVEDALLSHPALQVGARRASRLIPEEVRTAPVDGGVEFSFLLPSGCYATVLLREICGPRWVDAAADDPRGDPFVA
ncbi:MAG: tRNA pseudouridine(13) synthase TruD, partial [Myxococcota bacterium]